MLRVKDVARILDVSPASVYALCAAGKLRHYRIGAARVEGPREPTGKAEPETGYVCRVLDPAKFRA